MAIGRHCGCIAKSTNIMTKREHAQQGCIWQEFGCFLCDKTACQRPISCSGEEPCLHVEQRPFLVEIFYKWDVVFAIRSFFFDLWEGGCSVSFPFNFLRWTEARWMAVVGQFGWRSWFCQSILCCSSIFCSCFPLSFVLCSLCLDSYTNSSRWRRMHTFSKRTSQKLKF